MLTRQKTNESSRSKLYLVGTPIGNVEDMTYRAVKVLSSVDLIYCEDTRITKKLLVHYDINTKLKSYHLHNEQDLTEELINQVKSGMNIAIVSDAGMPVISDPGFLAVRDATKLDIDIVVIPGASAGITALVGSGITSNKFTFLGFLNSKDGKRRQEIEKIKDKTSTLIMYEAPHRIKETLEMLRDVMPTRRLVLARELTKKYEEYLRGTAGEILEVIEEIKGEIVLIVEGASREELKSDLLEMSIVDHYKYYVDIDYDPKEAMKLVSKDRHISKSIVYQAIHKK